MTGFGSVMLHKLPFLEVAWEFIYSVRMDRSWLVLLCVRDTVSDQCQEGLVTLEEADPSQLSIAN